MTTYAKHGAPDYASVTARGCEEAGEPVFLLRAQDYIAPAAVRAWATLMEMEGDPEMVAEALRIADQMEAWPHRKRPDA